MDGWVGWERGILEGDAGFGGDWVNEMFLPNLKFFVLLPDHKSSKSQLDTSVNPNDFAFSSSTLSYNPMSRQQESKSQLDIIGESKSIILQQFQRLIKFVPMFQK